MFALVKKIWNSRRAKSAVGRGSCRAGALSIQPRPVLSCAVLFSCLSLVGSLRASAADPTPDQLQFFETKIRPVLVENCYKCHSHNAEKLKGNLSVEFRDSLLKGGETGPAIIPGDPEHSLLIKAVRYTDSDMQMPPKEQLSETQIADLVTWVKMGAPDPRVAGGTMASADWGKNRREHWSFQPVKKILVPAVKETNWVSTPIDAFILAKLEANKMKPGPAADRRTLIRRATFDLTGLPPTPEESEAFVNDPSPDAYAKVVDRLLASPQYGERWGRYWLDTARYSDTRGDIKQQQDTPFFPYAWTYRDYVIRSFNEDKPYNKFLLEQIAGDHLPGTRDRQEMAALGFLTLGPRFNDNPNDIDNDRIDVVCKGTLGLTVTCARCHDHKFDPIPQTDYYALKGIFDSSAEPEVEPFLGEPKMTPEYAEFSDRLNATNRAIAAFRVKLQMAKRTTNTDSVKELTRDINQAMAAMTRMEAFDPASPPRATALSDINKPKDVPLLIRGEAGNRSTTNVTRHFLTLVAGTNPPAFVTGSGRLQLAEAIIDPKNPLTARVMINRIWLHHFGEGFVTTPDDFGNQSDPPSHPELLDYLAGEFVKNGWSIKKIHREIMLSSVYQESSENNPRYAEIDPQNRLLWRANIHRLELEAVRDSILAIGGQLDLTLGGPPVNLSENGFSHRRTIYGEVDRRNLPEVYSQFDFANPDITMGRRYETTVPQQALFMMNNPLVVELARKLVNLPEFISLQSEKARIEFLYQHILQRAPSDIEIQLAQEFVNDSPPVELITAESRDHLKQQRAGAGAIAQVTTGPGRRSMSLASIGPGQIRAIGTWVKYAHALLQTNEALFVN
jgi:mono/diheme cytochrome c family protein